MSDDDLDALYSVEPEGFTALRRQLADAAKQRGDAAAAKWISAARKPTTAAWIVNSLVLGNKDVRPRLSKLGDQLRSAHASMDGERIRKLSAEQRHTVDDLVRAGLQDADVKNPSAAIREDVAGTLHAAIADTEVAERLGRLTKAERWSGFGGFGAASPVSTAAVGKPADAADDPDRRRDESKAQLAQAKQELAAAQRRREKTRRELEKAQRDLAAATKARDAAEQADRDAAASVQKAQAQLRRQR
ncbi:MAG: hypothetical protein QOG47_2454 [Mycobacterium sp.]|jgi:hypothetical protein|nr:hypothetical protein [Mycobacterium sp.]MDT5166279.1 hypothetical protein [Mycobacterium sp.]